jgi:hypothetical protein
LACLREEIERDRKDAVMSGGKLQELVESLIEIKVNKA